MPPALNPKPRLPAFKASTTGPGLFSPLSGLSPDEIEACQGSMPPAVAPELGFANLKTLSLHTWISSRKSLPLKPLVALSAKGSAGRASCVTRPARHATLAHIIHSRPHGLRDVSATRWCWQSSMHDHRYVLALTERDLVRQAGCCSAD